MSEESSASKFQQTWNDIEHINAEANELHDKHGPLKSEAEAAFHIGRAYRTLERNLDDKYVSNAIKREKILHLAAVCLRAAQTIPVSDDQPTDK